MEVGDSLHMCVNRGHSLYMYVNRGDSLHICVNGGDSMYLCANRILMYEEYLSVINLYIYYIDTHK